MRKSSIYYINPSAIDITPNCNGTSNDIALSIERGTKIKVHCPEIPELKPEDGSYREWTITGRNRSLALHDRPYTIYARLKKDDYNDGYVVFTPKFKLTEDGEWTDAHPYVRQNGWFWPEGVYEDVLFHYYIRLGDVSEPVNGMRQVTLDTGILGTEQYNEQWEENPDELPLRIDFSTKVGEKELGINPYVYWGQKLLLTATLVRGWEQNVNSLVKRWTISRNSGRDSDSEWNGAPHVSYNQEQEENLEKVYIRTKTAVPPVIVEYYDEEHTEGQYLDSYSREPEAMGYLPVARQQSGGIIGTAGARFDQEWGDDCDECTETPQGTTQEWPYEWVITRQKEIDNIHWKRYTGTMVSTMEEHAYIRTKSNIPPVIAEYYDEEHTEGQYLDSYSREPEAMGYLPVARQQSGGIIGTAGARFDQQWGNDCDECTETPQGPTQEWPYEWVITRHIAGSNSWEVYSGVMQKYASYIEGERIMQRGKIELSHIRADDDFAGAVAAIFTVKAWAKETGADSLLAQGTITIFAETQERYELILSTGVMAFDPHNHTYNPENGIDIRIRRTDQRGIAAYLTKGQFDDALLAVQYRVVGTGEWEPLELNESEEELDESEVEAVATIPTNYFEARKNIDVRLVRISREEENSEEQAYSVVVELAVATVAYVRNGEDSSVREWIYFPSPSRVSFSETQEPKLPAAISTGEVNPTGAANGNDENKNQAGWVPNGWYDNPPALGGTTNFIYESYRDSSTNGWGPFGKPRIYDFTDRDSGIPEFRYQWNESESQCPDYVSNNENPGSGWNINIPDRPGEGYYLWAISAIRYSNGSYGPWGNPIRLTGEKGSPGEDAKEREWIYRQSDEPTADIPSSVARAILATTKAYEIIDSVDVDPEVGSNDIVLVKDSPYLYKYITDSHRVAKTNEKANVLDVYQVLNGDDHFFMWNGNNWTDVGENWVGSVFDARYVDDFVPEGWSDTALSVEEEIPFVLACWRDWDKKNKRWTTFQGPIVWSHWGHQGTDGDGVQYIFKLFDHELSDDEEQSEIPTEIKKNGNGEWLPIPDTDTDTVGPNDYWSDDPLSPTPKKPFCYCSAIKRINNKWGAFGKLGLWATYTESGLTADLDNEMDAFGTDINGKVITQQTMTTKMKMFFGTTPQDITDITASVHYASNNEIPEGVNLVEVSAQRATDTDTVTDIGIVNVTVKKDAIINDDLYVDITGTCGKGVRIARFTMKRVSSGAPGVNPTLYRLMPSLSSVVFNKNTTGDGYTQQQVILYCTIAKSKGDSTVNVNGVECDGYRIYWRKSNNDYYSKLTTGGLKVRQYDGFVELVLAPWNNDKVDVSAATGIIDRETIPVIQDGLDGDPGKDAKEREWIFISKAEETVFSGDNHPGNIKKDKEEVERNEEYIAETDNFVPYGWDDNAISVDDDTNKFVYASCRLWNVKAQKWDVFQDPILWSNWGHIGRDGDGVQYIFKLFDHKLSDDEEQSEIPTEIKKNENGEWLPKPDTDTDTVGPNDNWSDDPLSPVPGIPFCYCSVIKRINGEWEKSFGKLALWAKWSKDGSTVTIEKNSNGDYVWVIDGKMTDIIAEGKDGTGIRLKGAVETTDSFRKENGVYNGMVLPIGEDEEIQAEVGDCYVCEDDRHLYMWFSNTWRDMGEFKGEPGKAAYLHIAYATFVDHNNRTVENFTVTPDQGTYYDYMGICTDNQEADPGSEDRPLVDNSAKYSAYKWNFIRGKDGDGYEHVYLQTKDANKPGLYDNDSYEIDGKTIDKTHDEYRPYCPAKSSEEETRRWTDDPSGVNADWRFEWQATRRKINGSWGSFTVSDNPIHRFYRPPFWSRVYKRFNVGVTQPDAPTGGNYDNPLPVKKDEEEVGWSDGIPGPIVGESLVWTSRRRFDDDDPNTPWSTPEVDRDSNTLDIEYAFEQTGGVEPAAPTYDNRYKEEFKIWYDPVNDANNLPENKSWADMVWRAEREIGSQTWVITRIKGEKGDTGTKVKSTTPYFLALTSKVSSLVVNTKNTPPTSTVGGVSLQWQERADNSWSSTKKYLYRMDKNTAMDDSIFWTDPYFYAEWAEQGPEGLAAATVVFTPSTALFSGNKDGNVTKETSISVKAQLRLPDKTAALQLTNASIVPSLSSLTNATAVSISIDETFTSASFIITASGGEVSGAVVVQLTGTIDSKTYTAVGSLPVKTLKAGAEGGPGATGRMYYIAGKFPEKAPYTRTADLCPMVYYLAEGKEWWYLKADSAISTDTPRINSDKWAPVDNFGVVITDAVFVKKFAQFGSAIISVDWLFSLHGKIGNVPYGGTVENPDKLNNNQPAYTYFDPTFPMGKGSQQLLYEVYHVTNLQRVIPPGSTFSSVSYKVIPTLDGIHLIGGTNYTFKFKISVKDGYLGYIRLRRKEDKSVIDNTTKSSSDAVDGYITISVTPGSTTDCYVEALLQYVGIISEYRAVMQVNEANKNEIDAYLANNNWMAFYARSQSVPSAPTVNQTVSQVRNGNVWNIYIPEGNSNLYVVFGKKPQEAGNEFNITSVVVSRADNTTSFIPNYAVDLRTGKTYQNDAYIRGIINANAIYTGRTAKELFVDTQTLQLDPENPEHKSVTVVPPGKIVRLPSAETYEGMILRFYSDVTTRTESGSIGPKLGSSECILVPDEDSNYPIEIRGNDTYFLPAFRVVSVIALNTVYGYAWVIMQ